MSYTFSSRKIFHPKNTISALKSLPMEIGKKDTKVCCYTAGTFL